MAKKIRRGLFVTGGILLLVFLAVVLLVPRLVPGELISDQVSREVERATGATVFLNDAQLRWAGGWRLALREGSLHGTGQALAVATGSPNNLRTYDIEFEEFSVVPALLPLLKKELVVKEVRWSGPRLRVDWGSGEVEAADYAIRITDLNLGLDPTKTGAFHTPKGREAPPGDLIPADLAFSFKAMADTLVLQRVAYTEVDLRGNLAEKILTVDDLSGHRSTGTITGNLSIDFVTNPWGRFEFQAEARLVPAAALLKPWAEAIGNRLDCDLKTELIGVFDLRDQATVLRTLNVAGWMSGGPGVLHAGVWLREITPYLGDRQDLKDVRFRDLVHHFKFNQGRYFLEKLTLSGGDTEWGGQGWVDLEGNLVMGVDVKLPPGFTPDLGNFSFLAQTLRDSEGRINLPLKLSGRSDQPTVGVDLSRLRTP
jgi:hypothetical protein